MRRRAVRWAAVAAAMAVIFWLSAQTSDSSAVLSDAVVRALTRFGIFDGTHPAAASNTVRKAAHLVAYVILGAVLAVAWRNRSRTEPRWRVSARPVARGRMGLAQMIAVPWAAAVLFACTDEWHQTLVPGRTGRLGDVAIDAAGAAVGVLLAAGLGHRRDRRLLRH